MSHPIPGQEYPCEKCNKQFSDCECIKDAMAEREYFDTKSDEAKEVVREMYERSREGMIENAEPHELEIDREERKKRDLEDHCGYDDVIDKHTEEKYGI